ncbi:hypothetical protein [Croceicoccus mobilis]|uniref:Uncharacterized protein n=1 Tax=Croceicoccus mobilis TaxID=1703339 RepID=A0A916YWW3_9SPHN|nr:hypothetical protein [Croceicoccus mobilis]GGD64840.1 hypothetical protein GCM10010990_12910 [Croceicoccus mobilis]
MRAILIHDAMADFGWRVEVDDASWQRSCYAWHFPKWTAAVGVRVRGAPDSDWYPVSEIHPGRGRRIKLLDIARY